MRVGDLVKYVNEKWEPSQCMGMIIEIQKESHIPWPVYLVEWPAWPGEPGWYHSHNLQLISTIKDDDEKRIMV
jgi:hypothetical protein